MEYAKYLGVPYIVIVTLTRNEKKDKSLALTYETTRACEYYYKSRDGGHSIPRTVALKHDIQYIAGEFQKYRFQIRAFLLEQDHLLSVNLYSSEMEMLMHLIEENLAIEQISSEQTFRLRKLEYNLRQMSKGNRERRERNTDYHLQRLK